MGWNGNRRQNAERDVHQSGMSMPWLGFPAAAIAAAIVAALVAGCANMVAAGGAGALTAATQERGFADAISDTAIRADINLRWLAHGDGEVFLSTILSVVEGRVLLAGHVKDPRARVDAVRLAWKAEGVREVINEIRVAEGRGIAGYGRDAWVTATLRSRLLLDKEIASVNYTIDTVGKVVYLMGVARNAGELARVRAHARDVSYVKRVVSHVVLKNDPKRKAPPGRRQGKT